MRELIPIRTYTFTINTSLAKRVATYLLSQSPLIRNISCRITSETPVGLRGMYFPNTDPVTPELQEDLASLIERMLEPADGLTPIKVIFD